MTQHTESENAKLNLISWEFIVRQKMLNFTDQTYPNEKGKRSTLKTILNLSNEKIRTLV